MQKLFNSTSIVQVQKLSNAVTHVHDGLPCLVHDGDKFTYTQPHRDIPQFLALELDVSRLNTMATRGLWLAGRPGNLSALHRQRMLGRQIVVTEQLDLHLLWKDSYIFIKPLPAWLLDRDFVKEHILKDDIAARAMNGFLGTYAKLVAHPSDLRIARFEGLLPESMGWKEWRHIMDEQLIPLVCKMTSGRAACARRFQFGELRLSRVNMIYRYHPAYRLRHLIRGYHRGRQTYQSFLRRNFAWLVVVFVYITIVLTAMQVGTSTEDLQQNQAFGHASAGFAVFAILLPVATLVLILLSSLVLVVYNILATRKHLARCQERRRLQLSEDLC